MGFRVYLFFSIRSSAVAATAAAAIAAAIDVIRMHLHRKTVQNEKLNFIMIS